MVSIPPAIIISADGRWPHVCGETGRKRIKIATHFHVLYGKHVPGNERATVGGVYINTGDILNRA